MLKFRLQHPRHDRDDPRLRLPPQLAEFAEQETDLAMTTVVTGAAGFVGSHLADRLLRDRADLRSVDIRWGEHHDLARPVYAADQLRGASDVYHLAADMGGIGYISKDHARIAAANARIDLNVLQASREASRFYYASSACAYPLALQQEGAVPLLESDAQSWAAEPGYGVEKRFAEELVTYYGRDYGISTHITRFFNVYGREDKPEDRSKVITALCRKIARAPDGGRIEVWGDGGCVRDFVHVDDVVEIILRLMRSNYHQPVNVGTGYGTTIAALVQKLIAHSGKDLEIEWNHSAPTGVRVRVADITRMVEVTGYRPQKSLDQELPGIYDWIASQTSLPVI